MGGGSASPDIRKEPDAAGKLRERPKAPAPPKEDKRNFFQKFFGIGRSKQPTPQPDRRQQTSPFRQGGH
jgi:hypothetical protein